MDAENSGTKKGLLQKIADSVKGNPFAMMAVCCLLPIIVIIALQLLGFTGVWIYGLALFMCIGAHLAMAYAFKGEKSCH